MKWTIENLFKYNFIRPKGSFRYCYIRDCGCKKEFYAYEHVISNIKYKGMASRCKNDKCYDPDDEYGYGDGMPSYIVDFNLLQLVHEEHKRGYCRSNSEKSKINRLDYYKRLKKSVSTDPYFRHLKRVANRNKLKRK